MKLTQQMICSIDGALDLVQDNFNIVTAMAAAEPQGFFSRIADRARQLANVTVHCANPSRQYECFTGEGLDGRLNLEVMFLTKPVRGYQGHGRIHYVPQHLSHWVRNLMRGQKINVFWGSCSLPDQRGFVSLGPSACYETEIIRHADLVILEMNSHIPITAGATYVPLQWVTHLIAHEAPLPFAPRCLPTAEDHLIAGYVAELIPDEATIQLGIGSIPNAIGEALRHKRNLGVHSEMINDAIMDLYVSGAVSGRAKTLWPGKMVGSFVFGSQELYQFVNQNFAIELQPSAVVNDPYRLGRNYKMHSVNSAVEVDITGQVCSESVGHQELSGVGGAFETHTGAQRSEGGRGIIALRSRAKNGESKIVFELRPGAKVSIPRNDIDTVVTEFGVARLAGKSVAERVKALAQVAHPEFRDKLISKAKKAGYV